MTDESDNAFDGLRRQLMQLRVGIACLALAWLATVAWLIVRSPSIPQVISVERLEIVEPDGTPAFVLANSERPSVATIDGRQVMGGQEEERKGTPSIIFFDGNGDEVGGMLFGTRETANGYSAVRHLSFDAYKQDQTVVLAHYQDARGSTAGLTVSDRPEFSLLDGLSQLGLAPGASREQITAALQAIPESERASRRREIFGTTRAFLGVARSGEARLELRDGEGRARIVIVTPEDGEPSINILSETGEVVERIPE